MSNKLSKTMIIGAAAIVLATAGCGGSSGGSSGTPAQSDSYQKGFQFVSNFSTANTVEAKTTCGMLGVGERASLSDDEKNDWNQGCEDSLRAQGAS